MKRQKKIQMVRSQSGRTGEIRTVYNYIQLDLIRS